MSDTKASTASDNAPEAKPKVAVKSTKATSGSKPSSVSPQEKPTTDPTANTQSSAPDSDTVNSLLKVAAPAAGGSKAANQELNFSTPFVKAWNSRQRPFLEPRSDTSDTLDGNSVTIKLYAEGCLDCGHLVPSEIDPDSGLAPYPKCHFHSGNVYCPAGALRIEFVGERLRLISKFRKASAAKDANRIHALMEEIHKMDPVSRDSVLSELGIFSA
jgi:hypothetical protein